MKRSFLVAALLAACTCACLYAQSFSLITDREPVTSLDGLWRFHTGDNPAWAGPNFDDSQWQLLRSDESWTKQGYRDYGGYAWYRFTIHVANGRDPLALLLPSINTGYQVYADGKLIGSAASTAPTLAPSFARQPRVFRLPPGTDGPSTVQIAIRVWEYQPVAAWYGGGILTGGSLAGRPDLLALRLDALLADRVQGKGLVNIYASALLEAVVGLTILGLFLFRRKEREYLWFSVLLLVKAADAALLITGFDSMRYMLYRLADEVLLAAGVLAALAFFVSVLETRRSLWWQVAFAAAALSPLAHALYYLQWTTVGVSDVIHVCCLLPAYLWIIAALAIASARKNVTAWLLLAPAVLRYGYNTYEALVKIGIETGGGRNLDAADIALLQQPFLLRLSDVVEDIFVLALLMFLVRRFSLARKEEERMAGEFEAAKTVQSLLIPAASPVTPGFAVENVYLPAQEVGGDFFQVLPGNDGSLLIVVGDVSGKGLKAAMTVSAIVGTLRGSAARAPAEVLANLNGVLRGHMTGFVTCCAALVDVDGKLTIANAGHLSPYRNGEELAVPPGLPLGIADGTEYSETTYGLSPNDRLTFISDGVVEARNGMGELYGFDRAGNISHQPANVIAEAAKQWGQEDDITVLSVVCASKLESVTA